MSSCQLYREGSMEMTRCPHMTRGTDKLRAARSLLYLLLKDEHFRIGSRLCLTEHYYKNKIWREESKVSGKGLEGLEIHCSRRSPSHPNL